MPFVRAGRSRRLGARDQGGATMSATGPDAALDALADALAPRLFERLKRLAADEAERGLEDLKTLEFLEGLGWRRAQ